MQQRACSCNMMVLSFLCICCRGAAVPSFDANHGFSTGGTKLRPYITVSITALVVNTQSRRQSLPCMPCQCSALLCAHASSYQQACCLVRSSSMNAHLPHLQERCPDTVFATGMTLVCCIVLLHAGLVEHG